MRHLRAWTYVDVMLRVMVPVYFIVSKYLCFWWSVQSEVQAFSERWFIFATRTPSAPAFTFFCLNCFGSRQSEIDSHDESKINLDSNMHVCRDTSILITPLPPSSHIPPPQRQDMYCYLVLHNKLYWQLFCLRLQRSTWSERRWSRSPRALQKRRMGQDGLNWSIWPGCMISWCEKNLRARTNKTEKRAKERWISCHLWSMTNRLSIFRFAVNGFRLRFKSFLLCIPLNQ